MSISELLGLNLPRGPLLGNTSPLGGSSHFGSPTSTSSNPFNRSYQASIWATWVLHCTAQSKVVCDFTLQNASNCHISVVNRTHVVWWEGTSMWRNRESPIGAVGPTVPSSLSSTLTLPPSLALICHSYPLWRTSVPTHLHNETLVLWKIRQQFHPNIATHPPGYILSCHGRLRDRLPCN